MLQTLHVCNVHRRYVPIERNLEVQWSTYIFVRCRINRQRNETVNLGSGDWSTDAGCPLLRLTWDQRGRHSVSSRKSFVVSVCTYGHRIHYRTYVCVHPTHSTNVRKSADTIGTYFRAAVVQNTSGLQSQMVDYFLYIFRNIVRVSVHFCRIIS